MKPDVKYACCLFTIDCTGFLYLMFEFFLSKLFLLVFRAKTATTNNHRSGWSDISYLSLFSRDSNDIKKFSKKLCHCQEKPV